MQRTFKSKTGGWFKALVFCFLGLMCFCVWNRFLLPAFFFLVINVLVVKALVKTEYVVKEGALLLTWGYFSAKAIPVSDIVSVKESGSLCSAFANSLDRLEVKYKSAVVVISPEDKDGFVRELQKYNPDIAFIRYKKGV